jgi:uncharacterized membrane protein
MSLDRFVHLPLPIALHLGFALGALLLGPLVLWSRKGSPQHRAGGYLWVVLMLGAALSAVFIRDHRLPNLAGFTLIHLFVPVTLIGVSQGVWHAMKHRIEAHRQAMRGTYIGGCLVAGAFTLLPGRFMHQLVFRDLPALWG